MTDILKNNFKDRIALISEERELTYEYLINEVNLLSKSFIKGSIVLLACNNSIDSIILYLSLLKAKSIPILLSSEINNNIIENYIKEYKISSVILPNKKNFENYQKRHKFGEFVVYQLNNGKIIENSDITLLLTTSGSTGNPKLVRISDSNLISNTKSISQYLLIKSDDRHITTLPMNYTFGLSCINTFLYSGGSIVINNYSVLERKFWDLVEKFRPTSISGVPYTYEILNRIGLDRIKNSSFKVFTQAGGKLDEKILKKFSVFCKENRLLFYVMYGQTEATARMSYVPPNMLSKKIGSIGIPIPGGKFTLDENIKDFNQSSKGNKTGELIYEGNNVSLGYSINFEDLNNENTFSYKLRTGDIAYCDHDNYYYIIGRKNRFAKISGIRVSLNDIESILNKKGYTAIVTSDDNKLIIYVVGQKSKINNLEIKNLLLNETTLPFISFRIVNIDKLPRNENGKINYKKLNDL